ncbi:DNA-processing protein DprA [Novosphingobium sp. NBM11]|uniref:DNA-processing protein DprA n=1 Tax=Novosphingobium sp. NBM11 TaxID=2596914 RepID=UPI00281606D5|nr:DNA-processing protein DprA [Novosphingobium sp. NBM11]
MSARGVPDPARPADTPFALAREEAFARIRLLRTPHIGPASYFHLLRRYGSAVAALEAVPELAARGGGRVVPTPEERISAEIARVRQLGARYLFHDSPAYPALLAALDSPPPILTVRGDDALLRRPSVAIVGARNASAGAVKLARDFGAALAQAGCAVISGLARGIDAAAHRGALAAMADGGGTVGVIASGIDIAYPPENAALQDEVAEKGLLIAEMPPGTEPLARHFPHRNRIIAGLATGTLVVEAAPKSGSLITARLAGEAGREVMAIPGSPLDSRSHGCNQLIRDGAVLVQSPEDVLELLRDFGGAPRSLLREPEASAPSFPEEEAPADIEALLGAAPVAVDELVRQSGASPGAVQMALIELEIAGRLVRHAAGRVSLV